MKMKQYAAIAAAALLAAGLLAGCGTNASSSSSTAESSTAESSAVESSSASAVESSAAESSEEESVEETGTLTGGWTIFEDETKANIPEDAQKAFDDATAAYTGAELTPIAYLGSQVVAGTNYKFLCRTTLVTKDPVTKLTVATVYTDLDGKSEITDVKDFDLTAYTQDVSVETAESNLSGGWTVAENDGTMLEMPADIQEPFDKATETLTGATYEPVAILGTQVVAGQNTAILCRITTVTAEPTSHWAVVVLYTPVSGDPEITSVADLDLAEI